MCIFIYLYISLKLILYYRIILYGIIKIDISECSINKMALTPRQKDQLKCAGFYLGLLAFMAIIVVWNILEGPEKNVFVKMGNPGAGT